MTACKDCIHLLLKREPGVFIVNRTSASPIWYEMYCQASPIPPEFDPYTGKLEKQNEGFHFCRDINTGDCPKFEEAKR